jgi:hypothetical protein
MNRFERRNRAIDEAIREHIDAYKAIYKKGDDEDRDLTDDERLEIETHLKTIETLKDEKDLVEANIKTLQEVDEIARDLDNARSSGLPDIARRLSQLAGELNAAIEAAGLR